tara:strand:- start:592 stop:792 length:201 start_codon:yes stop_codon:yes gene_type:complete
MDWKQLPRVDKELVQYLKEKFPSPKFDPELTNDGLAHLLAIQHGREETITAIEQLISLQRKGNRNE